MEKDETIIENATILQKNGVKHFYDAILITDKGIYTGLILREDKVDQRFEEHHFIPRDQIERITAFDKKGKIQDIEL